MKSKLNNLISQEDFRSNWKAEQAKKTKRTDTGLDILNEDIDDLIGDGPLSDEPGESADLSTDRIGDGPGIEEIIPEGLPDDDLDIQEDIDHILDELSDLDDGTIDEVVNYLRGVLLEMEQNGEIDDTYTDELDAEMAESSSEGGGELWDVWIEEVITMPEMSEEAIRGVSDIIFGGSREDRVDDDDDDDNDLPLQPHDEELEDEFNKDDE